MLYDLHNKTFRLNISGSNFDLSQFPQLANRYFPIQGRMEFNTQAGGTFQRPAIQAAIHLRDVLAGRESLGNVTLQASTQNGELHLTAQSAVEQSRLAKRGCPATGRFPSQCECQIHELAKQRTVSALFEGPTHR